MTPDIWEAEFNRDGQVVLPLRPRSQLWRLGYLLFVIGLDVFMLVVEVTDFSTWTWTWTWSFWVIQWLILIALIALAALIPITKMVRRSPVVTISRHGVQKGRRSVSWDQIRRVERRPDRRVMLLTDRRPLRIDAEHTDNPDALAWWLWSVLERTKVR